MIAGVLRLRHDCGRPPVDLAAHVVGKVLCSAQARHKRRVGARFTSA